MYSPKDGRIWPIFPESREDAIVYLEGRKVTLPYPEDVSCPTFAYALGASLCISGVLVSIRTNIWMGCGVTTLGCGLSGGSMYKLQDIRNQDANKQNLDRLIARIRNENINDLAAPIDGDELRDLMHYSDESIFARMSAEQKSEMDIL
ncbi:MAG: hypothetical protein AAGG81_06025 [Chlamydiota bacterium]